MKKEWLRILVLAIFAAGLSVLMPAADAAGGDAPNFSLLDQDGKTHQLSELKDKVVVLEWTNPTCPFVVRHYKTDTMEKLAAKYQGKVVWLAINSGKSSSLEINKNWVKAQSLAYPVLHDADGKVGKSFGAKTTPHMFIVVNGKISYEGAIDDDPKGEGAKLNYVEQALDAILAGKTVPTAKSKPYGCSVKY